MDQNSIDWKGGQVHYWGADIQHLNPSRSPYDQIENMDEDLAQVYYPAGLVLDIGWYPSYKATGSFLVRVVENQDWQEPIFREPCRTFPGLIEVTYAAIDLILDRIMEKAQ